MTNTPTPRPDVAELRTRLKTYGTLASCDIRALIAHIEALEARQEKLGAVVAELQHCGITFMLKPESGLSKALAALDGGGDETGENHE